MSANSDYIEAALLNWFRGTAFPAPPSAVYVHLSSTEIQEDGTGYTLPTYTGYAPQVVEFGTVTAGSGTESQMLNSIQLHFGDPDQDGSVQYWGAWDGPDPSTANLLRKGAFAGGPINYQATVNDPLIISIGDMKWTED